MLADHATAKPIILVVDDSPEIRRYLTLLLQLESYDVESACGGAEALQRIREGLQPAAIVLDVQMPGMDGLQTLRHLRRIAPELKVIMCSGLTDARTIKRALLLGAKAYVAKPVQHLYLSAAIQRCLSGDIGHNGYASNSAAMMTPSPFAIV